MQQQIGGFHMSGQVTLTSWSFLLDEYTFS